MNKVEKEIIPELRFPEFENDGEWKTATLFDIATFSKGKGVSKKDIVSDGKFFCVRYGELYTDYNEVIDIVVSKTNLPENELILSQGNEVIIPSSGETRIDIAKASCVLHEGIALGGDLNIIKSEINGVFFSYYLNSAKKMTIAKMAQGVSVMHLYNSQLEKLEIEFPEPKEQQKIANCLSSLDNLITAESEKLDHLKDHKKGLLQQLFPANGKTKPQFRFPEFENDGDWEETTLGELAKFRRGSFPQPYGLAKWYDDKNGMPFIQVYDVDTNLKIKSTTKRRISELATKQSVFIEKGTVIITIQGSIGRVAITQYDAYIDRTLLLFEEFFKPIDKLFFAYVIQLLFEIEKQKAPGGIIKTITKEVLTSFSIYIPKIEEQQKIAQCLSSLDDLIEAQSIKIEALKDHKKGLMQQLFPNVNELAV